LIYTCTSVGIFKSIDGGNSYYEIYTSDNLSSIACTSDGLKIYIFTYRDNFFYALDSNGNELYSTFNAYGMYLISCSYNGLKVITKSPKGDTTYTNVATISIDGGINNDENDLPTCDMANNINCICSNSTGTTNKYGILYQYIELGTCLMEGSKIMTSKGEVKIEDLKKRRFNKNSYK